ncbi:hypothetical protein [Methylocystis sp.]|uniref:hypothetical protein n=1 Tax=Methylocystis sp. TaxID=1911079 RepID=UPI0025DE20B2|nr:hypothetical protein [Methylocystis sp.]
MTIDENAITAAERLAGSEEQAKRAGARAGLLGEGHPQGFDRWPSEAQWAFSESYERARHCRRVAEGKERVAPPVVSERAASTEDDWAAEYDRSAAIRSEFRSKETYLAFKRFEASGTLRILRRPDASSAA